MRFAIRAPVLLVVAATLGLVGDQLQHDADITLAPPDAAVASEVRPSLAAPEALIGVNFQVPRPFRVTLPQVSSNVGNTSPVPYPVDDLSYAVVIEVEVFDAEPEACCLPKTQVQLRAGYFLPAATFAPQMRPVEGLWLAENFTRHPMPDSEGCTWTRFFEPRAGPDLQLSWQGTDLWALTVYKPNWLYLISGCPRLDGEVAETQTRTMAKYLEDMFQQSTPILIFAPTPPLNAFANCVVGYGEQSGQGQYIEGRIFLYIWRGNCQVPFHGFPF